MKNDFRALCAELLQAMDEITEYEIVDWGYVKSKPLKMADKSMEEARAALAQQRANSRKAIDAIAAIGQEDENYDEDYGETQRLSNAVQSCLSQREEILSAFIAKYGFHPEMAVQIEQRQADGTSTWRIEKRPSPLTEEKGPSDEELLEAAAKALGYKSIPSDETCLTAEAAELLTFAHAVLARWCCPTPQPIPLSERTPEMSDCNAEGECWTTDHDPSLCYSPVWKMTNHPSAFPAGCGNLKDFRKNYFWRNVNYWLPHWALPIPTDDSKE